MFLQALSQNEKKHFIKLAYKTAAFDGDYAQEEKAMINQYAKEMDIQGLESLLNNEESIDTLIGAFKDSNQEVINIAFVELMGLILSDGKYAQEEKMIIDKYLNTYNLTPDYAGRVKAWVTQINAAYVEAGTLLKENVSL